MQTQGWTATQKAVGQIWSDILKIDDIGLDEDFFDLGGTSLALISVVMRMGERFGLPLETAIVTEGATVAALAQGVDARLRSASKLARV